MVRLYTGSGCRPQLAVLLFALTLALVGRPAYARQVLLVANGGNNTVGEYSAVSGAAINPAFINGQGLNLPGAVALDGNNHLFVVSAGTVGFEPPDIVGQYDATTGATINASFLTISRFNTGLAADSSNHLFVSDYFGGVSRFDANTGALLNSFRASDAEGLALDKSNHVFVGGYSGGFTSAGTVGEYDASSGAAVNPAFIAGLTEPFVAGIDQNNHLFVGYSNTNGASVYLAEYDATTGATINAVLVGYTGPIAFDGNNHMFMANRASSTVDEYDATTGALINTAFISGLANPSGLLFVAPVPEPSSLLLVAATSIAAIVRRRRFTRR